MFIARTEELSKLSAAMKQTGHASLVYGKRRVGKTRLIKEALKQQRQSVIYYIRSLPDDRSQCRLPAKTSR